MNDDLMKLNLPKDARLAAKCLADSNSFETGQAILKECADRIEELERLCRGQEEQLEIQGNNLIRLNSHSNEQAAEIERLKTQCEGLAQAAMNNGQALIIAKHSLEKAVEAIEYFLDGWGLDGPDYKIDHYDKQLREQEWAFSKFRTTLAEIKESDNE
jgi:TolA-binding protein